MTGSITSRFVAAFPLATNSLNAVVARPGFRKAAMQRVRFHCSPISLAAVLSTDSALVCLFSLRVMSGTRAKLVMSRFSVDIGAELTGAAGACVTGAAEAAAAEYCGVSPAER